MKHVIDDMVALRFLRLVMRHYAHLVFVIVLMAGIGNALAFGQETPAQSGPTTRPGEAQSSLRLLPKAKTDDRAQVEALTGPTWAEGGPRDILGRGRETLLTFRQGPDRKLLLDRVTRTYHSVNDKAGPWGRGFDELKQTDPAEVDGPLLRFANEQLTFAVLPGKQLVLNAVVPIDGKWYYAARQNWAEGNHRDEEVLLDFSDDPLKSDAGKGTIQMCNGNQGRILKDDVTFTLVRSDKTGRLMRVVSTDPRSRARWAEILFAPDGKYGLMLDKPNLNSRVFTPAGK